MTDDKIPRRDFLRAAGTIGAAAVATSLCDTRPAAAQPRVPAADTILKNAKIVTVDAAFSIARAIAIAGERILAVGPDAAMAAHTAPTTRVLDLDGNTVVPGLIDGHGHVDRE